jgi:hypothetical protein
MSSELIIANVVRQIIVKAWTDPKFKQQVVDSGRNVIKDLAAAGFSFPKYGGYEMYPDIRVVECKLGEISYIVVPPKPTQAEPDLTDLAVVAARGNTVLGI